MLAIVLIANLLVYITNEPYYYFQLCKFEIRNEVQLLSFFCYLSEDKDRRLITTIKKQNSENPPKKQRS
jgi:hypothetical protein